MNNPRYALYIYDKTASKKLLEWDNLASLPRLQVGDRINAASYDLNAGSSDYDIVREAHYSFTGDGDDRKVLLWLRVESEF